MEFEVRPKDRVLQVLDVVKNGVKLSRETVTDSEGNSDFDPDDFNKERLANI